MQDNNKKTGIHQLYRETPETADNLIWDRDVDPVSRRGFLKKSSLLTMTATLGAVSIPFADMMPSGLIPAALADTQKAFKIAGKNGLIILNDRPISAETPPHLLDDDFTPAKYFFVRNNGIPPKIDMSKDINNWQLEISGESCSKPQTFTLSQLKQKFKHYTYALTLECGGNGRHEFNPSTQGNQWTTGAVGCAKWTGVRLKDVLKACGIKNDAVYVAYYGSDTHLSGDTKKAAISRGVPMNKALENETLIAWGFNGENIPYQNGYPLRLISAGWPASTSGKWLKNIVVRNKIHDGEKMTGQSYKIPCSPVAPHSIVPEQEMCIIESMPVKSLITFPKTGISQPLTQSLVFRGKAWAGDLKVTKMQFSIDFGATWQTAKLEQPVNRLAWQKWQAKVDFPETGYYEVWAKATDSKGQSQPMIVPGWNPKGYLNNACHRIAVQVV